MKIRYILWGTVVLLAILGFLFPDAHAQRVPTDRPAEIIGQLVRFDFGLINAPTLTGIPANNLRCIQIQRFEYKCFDITNPQNAVPFSTAPVRTIDEIK